jgi:hypothetical protein
MRFLNLPEITDSTLYKAQCKVGVMSTSAPGNITMWGLPVATSGPTSAAGGVWNTPTP